MQTIPRFLAAGATAALAVCAACAATTEQIQAESAKANTFFDRVFDESVARSPQFMTQLGLKKDYDKWDDLSEQHALEEFVHNAQDFAELKRTINFDLLDDSAKTSYRLFVHDAESTIEGWKWRYHNYPLNQMSGLHSEAPAFLINYHRVDSADDARAYLARLRGMGPMFDQLIDGVKLRAAKGILPPRFVYGLVLESCREVVAGEPFDQSGKKSALLEDIEGKVGALKDVEAAAKAQLLADARAALTGVVQPAYARLITLLEAHEKLATNDDGVWKLPDGREYYAYRLRQSTTTGMSAEEIHQLGLREVARIHQGMEAIMKQTGFKGDLTAFFKFIKEDPQFYYPTTPEGKAAYLKRASEIIADMTARLDEFFGVKPKAGLQVRVVEPFREKGAAGAFYEEPAPDGSRPGVYYVNTVDMRGVPIFEMETLAHHEAIPGHHMQIAIAQELTGIPKFRKFGGNTAYVEGWALYAEYFPKEFGFYKDPYQDFGRLYDELLRAVRLVVDTGAHAKHWTREQVMDYFRKNTPNPERDIFTETNRYIVWPGQATAYKVGQLKILEMRELAKKELGAKFSLREYHDLILKDGALPMELLEENVRAWIARKKG
ncbi:MAG: DUF885 domain-containing protein [bacterium]|nr:DUF885 domain-containing protein [bacterium]MDI1336985.1 DUF885 domain-containing protein [Lacunisphaera sp.]